MLKNLTLSALGFLVITSCTAQNRNTNTITTITTSPLELPKPTPLKLRDLNWIVVNEENVDSIIKQEKTIIALTVDGYERLNLNLNDLRSFIQEQTVLIIAYEEYYER